MEKLYTLVLCFFIIALSSCTDTVVDAAGTCVTCSMTATSMTVEACADGEGNLDVTTTDASGASSTVVSTDFNLEDFQIAQEATGATCN